MRRCERTTSLEEGAYFQGMETAYGVQVPRSWDTRQVEAPRGISTFPDVWP